MIMSGMTNADVSAFRLNSTAQVISYYIWAPQPSSGGFCAMPRSSTGNSGRHGDARMTGFVVSRRRFLASSGLGMGSIALAALLEHEQLLADESSENAQRSAVYNDLRTRPSHFP